MPIHEQRVSGSIIHDSTLVDAGDTTSVATLVGKTVSTGKTGKLMYASFVLNSGTPTVQLQLVRGATIVVIRSDTASWEKDFASGISLISGDIIRIQITAGSSGNADALLSVEEYD